MVADVMAPDLPPFPVDADAFDRAVAQVSGIDAFCSASPWLRSAHAAFTPKHQPRGLVADDGFAVWAETHEQGQRAILPMEAMWLLGTPIIGPPRAIPLLVDAFAAAVAPPDIQPGAVFVSGLQRDSLLFNRLAMRFRGRFRLFIGMTSQRHQIDLSAGFDAWFGRRSAGFRKKTRQGLRHAMNSGLALEYFDASNCNDGASGRALYERIYRIETRSWKGMEGSGFVDGGMRAFYAAMVPMLAERGALRAIIGRVGETDVCFIFGGIFAGTFRGLQMSFDENFRELELGNAMQILMLQRLQHEGLSIYDLGSDMAYKARWSDQVFETVTLVARP